ncbi:hypothetical protein N7461_004852 [Penicillium sp. DV-2018c]|nr:hypothetical protein N7461_004852 [Penicillium sp. DV-2018c]
MASMGYPCGFQGCNARYQRKSHLRRHEAQHRGGRTLQCSTCTQEFTRRIQPSVGPTSGKVHLITRICSDTLRRHVQTVHGIAEPPPQVKQACTHCRNQKTRCQGGPPCSNCQHRGVQCSLTPQVRLVQPGHSLDNVLDTQSMRLRSSPAPPRMRRSETEDRFVNRYFDFFHPHWPFIHRGTFTDYETPLLVQSMVVIGLWMTEEEKTRSQAVALHNVLGTAIRQQTEQWDGSLSKEPCASSSWPIPTYQAILLHIISAGMIKGSGTLPPDLKPSLTAPDADLLQRLVASCKKLGMFYYPNILAQFPANQPPAYVWVSVEEIKRFNVTLFKVCKSFSISGRKGRGLDGLLDDREKTVSWRLSARDLQFPLPRNAPLWHACNANEWFAADTENVYRHGPDGVDEGDWISASADVLDLTESW